jgi:ParB family chromosome partitioning protein
MSSPKQKMKVQLIDPKRLEEPDVRITSAWDPEMLPMLKASIEADGIQQPLIVIREGEHLWIVDGKHRRDEALLKGLAQVPCVVQDGSMRQVMTRNLYVNRLRGGIKASEMIKVVKWLQEKEGMGIEQIEKETGLKRDYIEKIIQCTRAVAEVLDELDRERIGVGHAWEIARINDRDVQLRLLAQTLQYRLVIKDLHEVVESTLEILRTRSENPPEQRAPDPTAVPTIRCHGCELDWPLKKVVGVNLCISCYGLLQDEIQRRRKEGAIPPKEPETHNT